MPNLVITNRCNLSCPFCFASEYRADGSAGAAQSMTLEEFRAQLEFVGTDTVRFCGGEPTLHPEFPAMLSEALAPAERRVLLMTNGLWPTSVRQQIAALPRRQANKITYLVNVLEPGLYGNGQQTLLEQALEVMDRRRVTLGVTLYRPDFDIKPLLALAERYRINHLRYSVAAPNITDPRSWQVEPKRDFPGLAGLVYRLFREARTRGLRVHSDCGYIPPCMFTSEQLVELRCDGDTHEALSFRCSGPVDIGPGGEAWRCYGLYASVRANTGEFARGAELAAHFERRTQLLDDQLLFDECADCLHRRQGTCGGGCYAFRVERTLAERAHASGVSLADDEGLLTAVPWLEEETLHLWQRAGQSVWMLREADGTWAELQLNELEHRVISACDGSRSLSAIVEEVREHGPRAVVAQDVARIVRRLYEQGAIALAHSPGL